MPNSRVKPVAIRFFYQERNPHLQQRHTLKRFIVKIFASHRLEVDSLNYIFCSDKALLGINQQYLQHDYYTDIITFDLGERPGRVQAEIYISLDRVRDNAKTLGVSIKSELHRVIFHGALHLCGFNDKSQKDQAAMRSEESRLLKAYFR